MAAMVIGIGSNEVWAMLSPTEDFATWSLLFLDSIEPGGDYQSLAPGFVSLVDQLLASSILAPPLSDFTSTFLATTLPDTARKLLRIWSVSGRELDAAGTLTLSCLRLIPWAASRDDFGLSRTLLPLLTEDLPFSPDGESARASHCEQLLALDSTKVLADRILDPSNPPSFDHFEIFFRLHCFFEQTLDAVDIKNVLAVVPVFEDLMNRADIQKVALATFFSIAQSLWEVMGFHAVELGSVAFVLYSAADKLLESEVLQTQIAGARILGMLGSQSGQNDAFFSAFEKWRESTTLRTILMERDLHPQLFEVLEKMIGVLLTGDFFKQFWAKIETAHSSERPKMLRIAAEALKLLPESEVRAFVERITDIPDLPDLLTHFLVSGRREPTPLNLYILDKLISSGSKSPEKFMAGLPRLTNHAIFVSRIIEMSMNRLLELPDFLCSLLLKIVRETKVQATLLDLGMVN
jgi:hypothetical protein